MTEASETAPVTVAIIEDHPITAEGLAARLAVAGMAVVASFRDVESFALTAGLARPPDVVLCDLRLPGLSHGKAVAWLENRGCRVLAMSGWGSSDIALEAVAHGARGYLPKNDPPERFAEAILEVAAVGYHISARLAVYLRDDLRCRPLQPELADADRALLDACADGDLSAEIAARAGMSSAAVSAAFTRVFGAERRRRSDPRYRPTAREEEVMILAGCAGLSDQAIARQLGGINTETVTSHLAHLKSKYQRTHPDDAGAARISPRATAVRWARDLGLCLLVQVFRDSGDASSGGRMGAGSKFPVRERSFVSCVAADY